MTDRQPVTMDQVKAGIDNGSLWEWVVLDTYAAYEAMRGAIAAQDEREQRAGALCGVPYELHGCDWPDAVAERVVYLQARAEAAEATVARLTEALRTYGHHFERCAVRNVSKVMWPECNCGFGAALSRTKE